MTLKTFLFLYFLLNVKVRFSQVEIKQKEKKNLDFIVKNYVSIFYIHNQLRHLLGVKNGGKMNDR